MRELKLSYLDRVQQEIQVFLNEKVKHNFLQPDREDGLSLDLTIKEAEILMSANDEVRGLAESGALKQLHQRYTSLKNKVEQDYHSIREQLVKNIQIIEGKENELYTRLINDHQGFQNIKLHGENAPLLDVLGLATGDNSFSNLSILEGSIEKTGDDQLKNIHGWLHAYLGVKAKIFEIETCLREDYTQYVALESRDEQEFSKDEWRKLTASRDSYRAAFSSKGQEVADHAKSEYDTFIDSLSALDQTHGNQVTADFIKFNEAYQERQNVYSNFSKKNNASEALVTFR